MRVISLFHQAVILKAGIVFVHLSQPTFHIYAPWNFMQNALSLRKFLHLSLCNESSCLFWFLSHCLLLGASSLVPTLDWQFSWSAWLWFWSLSWRLPFMLFMLNTMLLRQVTQISLPVVNSQDTAPAHPSAQASLVWELTLIVLSLNCWGNEDSLTLGRCSVEVCWMNSKDTS